MALINLTINSMFLITLHFSFLVDIALDILNRKPELAKERVEENGESETAWHLLARKPNAIGSSDKFCFWKRYINFRN